MTIDLGPKRAEVLPETIYLTRQALDWLSKATGSAEGRDFFGKVFVELTYEAGQVSVWRKSVTETKQ